MRNFLALAAIPVLSGCLGIDGLDLGGGQALTGAGSGGGTNNVQGWADDTVKGINGGAVFPEFFSDKGYATAGLDMDTAGQTIVGLATQYRYNYDKGEYDVPELITVGIKPSGDPGVLTLSVDNLIVDVDGQAANNLRSLVAKNVDTPRGEKDFELLTLAEAGNNQVWLIGIIEENSEGPGTFWTSDTTAVIGLNTDPDVIAAAKGMALYFGDDSIVVTVAGKTGYGFAQGDIRLTVDFDRKFVSGSADFGPGLAKIDFDRAQISGGQFTDGELVINPAEWGLRSIAGEEYSGYFYGPDGEAIGGNLNAVGQDSNDDTVLIYGYFVAD